MYPLKLPLRCRLSPVRTETIFWFGKGPGAWLYLAGGVVGDPRLNSSHPHLEYNLWRLSQAHSKILSYF